MTYSGAARLGRAVLRGDRQSQEQQGKAPKRIMQELSSTPLEKVIRFWTCPSQGRSGGLADKGCVPSHLWFSPRLGL